MFKNHIQKLFLPSALLLSIFAHMLLYYGLNLFTSIHSSPPVTWINWVSLEPPKQGTTSDTETEVRPETGSHRNKGTLPTHDSTARMPNNLPEVLDSSTETVPPSSDKAPAKTPADRSAPELSPAAAIRQTASVALSSLPLNSSSFLTSRYEKLTYQISMYGIPIGRAELEAKEEQGEVVISLRTQSNEAFSSIYLVDNYVESRHISGKFIMTKIRQEEGGVKKESEFTINLDRKRVTWNDRVTGIGMRMVVPADDVLDTLSGIYLLRIRKLQVGQTETLHIFDSETYADVPVEILHREQLRLHNLSTINTLVVRPLQNTAGIFRRSGDILLWLTDDGNRVPVRIVSTIALGKVTADLISIESSP